MTIGAQLDRGIFPRVTSGGVVTPGDVAALQSPGEEYHSVKRETSVGSQERPRRQETSRGSRPTGHAASLIGRDLEVSHEKAIEDVSNAYPGTVTWWQEDGVWLLCESAVLSGLDRAATFLVGISYRNALARAWGFWHESAVSVKWIGPRHTNFPDGSVCAFAPADGTWRVGDPVVELLDLYSVWALRHLHFEVFSHWPGPQTDFLPYERMTEVRTTELCTCGSGRSYEKCCWSRDQSRDRLAEAIRFGVLTGGVHRAPPIEILETVLYGTRPPELERFFVP
jgi:hypothetical protein